jgi:hypothetical protein
MTLSCAARPYWWPRLQAVSTLPRRTRGPQEQEGRAAGARRKARARAQHGVRHRLHGRVLAHLGGMRHREVRARQDVQPILPLLLPTHGEVRHATVSAAVRAGTWLCMRA